MKSHPYWMPLRRKIAFVFSLSTLSACATHPEDQLVRDACDQAPAHTATDHREFDSICDAAAAGKKRALLELGKRFEDGRAGITRYDAALEFYTRAAMSDSKDIQTYVPPLPGESAGRVITMPSAVTRIGEPEALYRLGLMYRDGGGMIDDPALAQKFFNAASAAGYSPTISSEAQGGKQ